MKIDFGDDPALEAEINSAASVAGTGAEDVIREALKRGLQDMGRARPSLSEQSADSSNATVTVTARGVVVVLPEGSPVERILAVAHGLEQMRLL